MLDTPPRQGVRLNVRVHSIGTGGAEGRSLPFSGLPCCIGGRLTVALGMQILPGEPKIVGGFHSLEDTHTLVMEVALK